MFSIEEFTHFYSEYISNLSVGEVSYLHKVFIYSPRTFNIKFEKKEILRLRNVKIPENFKKELVLK